jgi:hypothetical protein
MRPLRLARGSFVYWWKITIILALQVAFWTEFKRDREMPRVPAAAALVPVCFGTERCLYVAMSKSVRERVGVLSDGPATALSSAMPAWLVRGA